MGATFTGAMRSGPRNAKDDQEWLTEIREAEEAIGRLLEAKKRTRKKDPQREYVLHNRYASRLATLKRMCDAACL